MTNVARCCSGSCPSAPAITLNQTVIQADGLSAAFRFERAGDGTSNSVVGSNWTLLYTPLSPNSIVLTVGGVRQRLTADYSISGKTITFKGVVPVDADQVVASYVSTEAGDTSLSSAAIGAVVTWMGNQSVAPSGWLLCDGTAVSRTTYSELFGVIGTTYGAGDGSTTFNLPDYDDTVSDGSSLSSFVMIIRYQ